MSVVRPQADFGPLIIATDVDDALIATLRLWLPTYLAQVELERGLDNGSLPRPVDGSFANTLDDDEFADHMLPAVIVTTASTSGSPAVTMDNEYLANWLAIVTCVVRGQRGPVTRHIAALFEGCVRRVLVQQGGLSGFAQRCWWQQSRVRPIVDLSGKGRYLAAGMGQYVVHVGRAAVSELTAPTVPDSVPYAALATVQTVTTEVDGVPIGTDVNAPPLPTETEG